VLEIMQRESGRSKGEADLSRFVDESIMDELDREGFFKRLETENPRK
jgi:hypothetical protein